MQIEQGIFRKNKLPHATKLEKNKQKTIKQTK
jgi:hypothetical protein